MMSESGDSFEEIDFMSSVLGGSSVGDQGSSDAISSDQQLAGESSNSEISNSEISNSERSTTTMTDSTNQAKAAQLKEPEFELEFELAWATRDEIICKLNQHTKLLSGLVIKADEREKQRKENNDLVTALMNLPVKVDGRLKSFESFQYDPDGDLNEVVLDLSADVRSRILDTLTTNHSIALLGADSVSSECKSKLIDRNHDLICELLKLASRTVSKGDRPDSQDKLIANDQKSRASEEERRSVPDRPVEQSVEQLVNQEKLKKELEKLVGTIASELSKQISGLAMTVRDMKDELVEVKQVDACRKEAVFTFELKGVAAMLADPKKMLKSEFVYCRGMLWYVKAYLDRADGVEHLSIYLAAKSINKCDNWNLAAACELRILASGPGCMDIVRIMKDQPFNKVRSYQDPSWGWPKFITVDRLRAGSFIQNDTIKIRMHLITKNFERAPVTKM